MAASSHSCWDCGEPLDQDRSGPCRGCGSQTRHIQPEPDRITVHEQARLVERDSSFPRHGGRTRESKRGEEIFSKTGEVRSVIQIYDRLGDWRYEYITGADGRVIKHKSRPLSEHRDHGSAKRPKP